MLLVLFIIVNYIKTMVTNLKILLDLKKQREDLLKKIEELKNLPDDMVLPSSDPDEKDKNDVIKSLKGRIELIDAAIERLI